MNPQDAQKEKRAVLRFLSNTVSHEVIKLRKGSTIFGREKGDILIKDKQVSATHCQIQYVDGSYMLFDMNSSNGTFVNRAPVTKYKLQNGDLISLGETLCLFELSDEISVKNVSSLMARKKTVSAKAAFPHKTSVWGVELGMTYPNGQGEQVRLPQMVVTLGRSSSFAAFDQDPKISRKHLLIKVNESGEVFIEDQGSSNGSFINGLSIQGIHMVRAGDVITIGGCLLKIAAYQVGGRSQ